LKKLKRKAASLYFLKKKGGLTKTKINCPDLTRTIIKNSVYATLQSQTAVSYGNFTGAKEAPVWLHSSMRRPRRKRLIDSKRNIRTKTTGRYKVKFKEKKTKNYLCLYQK